jgi:hypothetical protein
MDKETQDLITRVLMEIKTVEEKFRNIQENSALYVSENSGLNAQDLEILKKLISSVGEANIAADAIIKRASG